MLGFTLSKLNLLIFVIAVFSIVSYFIVAFQTNATTKIALDLVKNESSDAYSIISSDSLCDSKQSLLPASLSPDASIRNGSLYVMKISKIESGDVSPPPESIPGSTKIVFAIAKRKTQNELISASSIEVKAKVYLFEYDTLSSSMAIKNNAYDFSVFDPQAVTRINEILLIKEVINGVKHIYLIPCSADNSADDCKYFRNKAMTALKTENSSLFNARDEQDAQGGFKC